VASRTALRELAEKYGLPLWMSEVARGEWDYKEHGADARDFRLLRGRANHIQSEFLIARASAFFGMNAVWSRLAHERHFQGRKAPRMFDGEGDDLVLFDQKYDAWFVTGIAYAIGHYSRWITPGETIVLESSSSNPLVPVTAFRDKAKNRYVLVVLNNDSRPHGVSWPFNGRAAGEQSTESAYWRPIRVSRLAQLPPYSITTLVEGEKIDGRPPIVTARARGSSLSGSVKGKVRSVSWIQVSGPAPATIDNPASLSTTLSNLQSGEYAFRLFAVGADWRAGSATVAISWGGSPEPQSAPRPTRFAGQKKVGQGADRGTGVPPHSCGKAVLCSSGLRVQRAP
jgi:hypothetical protein